MNGENEVELEAREVIGRKRGEQGTGNKKQQCGENKGVWRRVESEIGPCGKITDCV